MAADAPRLPGHGPPGAAPGTGPFPYMRWAREHLAPDDPASLGLSGLGRPGPEEVPGLSPPPGTGGGDPEALLREAIARRSGLRPDGVHLALGTSHANFLVHLAFARGAHVAAEEPAYEALHRLGPAVGAAVSTFLRDPARGWRIDPASLERAVTPATRLLCVTDLHNPSGMRLHPGDLDLLVGAANRVGAALLVDEVYRDLDPEPRPSAVHRDPCVLVTDSLTKSHGLWDLRCGWILGQPDRIRELVAWDDLVIPRLPLLPMGEALRYLAHAEGRLAAARTLAAGRRAQVDAWVRGRADVTWTPPDGGLTGFLLPRGPDAAAHGTAASPPPGARWDGSEVAALAWEIGRVRIVPGAFFQRPAALRISFGLDEERLAASLAVLGLALDRAAGARPPDA